MPRYIDADALKAKYEQMLPEIGDGYHKETLQDVLFELEYAPTISPDELRGVGKWVSKTMSVPNAHGQTYNRWGCSVCKAKFKSRTNYCPNCGAKMEVSEDA